MNTTLQRFKEASAPVVNASETDERQYFESITHKIGTALKKVHDNVISRHQEMMEIKEQLQEHSRDLDHVDKANLRQAADMASRVGEHSIAQRKKLERLLASPYFGRIDSLADGHHRVVPIYIGVHSLSDPQSEMPLIHDWRAPVSSMFYDFELGQAHYEAPSGRIECSISLKRQYRIEKQQFRFMLESSLNIQDGVLQEELSRASDDKLKTIVATIQRDQNAIIRNDHAHTLIIQGAAGSGKTSIALHRIAYLLYKHKDSISSDDILIVSPNKVFAHYISQVLPELGEHMIRETTMEAIANDLLDERYRFQTFGDQISLLLANRDPQFGERIRFKATADFVEQLDRYLHHVRATKLRTAPIRIGMFTLDANWVMDQFRKRSRFSTSEQINGVVEAVVDHMRFQHQKPVVGKERARIRGELRKMVGDINLKNIYKNFYTWLNRPEMFKPAAKGSLEYSDVFPDRYSDRRRQAVTTTCERIKMKRISVFLLGWALLLSPAVVAERLPNIVLFLVDDLGQRDLGCYGSTFYETPSIDQLAREGVRFTDAYASCHVCSPTRASIMTGKSPARLHMTDWLPGRKEFPFQKLKNAAIHQHLPFEETTIAEALKQHGYATGHFGKWHLGEEPSGPLAHGFDVQVPRWNKGWPKLGYNAPFGLEGLEDAAGDYLTDRLTDEALRFIQDNQDRPFFLYLSHFAVHDPIEGRKDLVEKYRAKLQRNPARKGEAYVLEGNPDAENRLSRPKLDELLDKAGYSGYRVLPNRLVKIKQHQDNIQFAAMIESMDESLGRVLEKLKLLGLEENTIVVLASDNGGMSAANFGRPERVVRATQLDAAYSTSNLPLRGGKGWLYEGGIRVPLIVKWPRFGKRGAVRDVPVISMDLYPSLLEMIGVPTRPEQHIDGVSLVPVLNGAKTLSREAICWHFPHYSNHGMQSPGGAIRRDDYKLLEYFENNTIQLFNLREDPGEKHDLAQEQPETAAHLRAMLHQWRDRVRARMMDPNPDYRPMHPLAQGG